VNYTKQTHKKCADYRMPDGISGLFSLLKNGISGQKCFWKYGISGLYSLPEENNIVFLHRI
jgi:hypothetical protein